MLCHGVNIVAALDHLLSGAEFDLAFLDEHYSDAGALCGRDVTKKVGEHENQTAIAEAHRLVIIGVTGDQGMSGFDSSSLNGGQDAVWGKPLPKPEEMKEALRAILERRGRCEHTPAT